MTPDISIRDHQEPIYRARQFVGSLPLPWPEGINSHRQQSGPQVLPRAPRNLMQVLRILSAHIALFLPLSHLRLQFLLLLEATSTADSYGAKVSVTVRWEHNINESFLWGNLILLGNVMLEG